jgi:hypothetical protein
MTRCPAIGRHVGAGQPCGNGAQGEAGIDAAAGGW